MPAGKLVTLKVYEHLYEARLAKKTLEDAGVPAYIGGEALALVGSKPGLTSLKLEVAEEDLEHARLVLQAPAAQPQRAADYRQEEINEDGSATITVFYDAVEAEHASQLLQAHGIPCQLRGAQSGFMSIISPAAVSIDLLVREEDVERVCDILGFTTVPDDLDDPLSPDDEPEPAPHAIWSESPPPSAQPQHIKRAPQTLQPAPGHGPGDPASPTVSPATHEDPPLLLDRSVKEDETKPGMSVWVQLAMLLLSIFLAVFLWAAFH